MMVALQWAVTCFIPLFLSISSKSLHFEPHTEYKDIEIVVESVEKLIDYYKKNVKNLNLDGFFGLRILEGNILTLIKENNSGQHQHIPESFWINIKRLIKRIAEVTAEGLEFVRKDNPQYFDDFSPVVNRPWTIFKDKQKLKPDLRWEIPQYKLKANTHLSENLSDRCMKEILGSSPSECKISEQCVQVMTTRGLTGYSITHQLLWSILAEKSVGCKASLNALLSKHGIVNFSSMQLEMCTNNFYEMVAVVHVLMKGKIHESHQDLFLEQQFMCPSLGFYEFIKKDYLDQILSWQFSTGCFGENEENEDSTYDDADMDIGNLLETYHNRFGDTDPTQKRNNDVNHPQHQTGINRSKFHLDMNVNGGGQLNNAMNKLPQQDVNLLGRKLPLQRKNSIKSHHSESLTNNINAPRNEKLQQESSKKKEALFMEKRRKWNSLSVPNDDKINSLHIKKDYRSNMDIVKRKNRRLLVEKDLEGGCLSHKTGVGAGALAIYLHYLIQPGDIRWNGPHEVLQLESKKLIQSKRRQMEEGDEDPAWLDDDNDNAGIQSDEENEYEDATDEDYDDYVKHYENNDDKMTVMKSKGNNRVHNADSKNNFIDKTHPLEKDEEDHFYNDDDDGVMQLNRKVIEHGLQDSLNSKDKNVEQKSPRNNYSFSNSIYGHINEESATTSHPGTMLVFFVSVTPIFILMFFLVRIVRCSRFRVYFHL